MSVDEDSADITEAIETLDLEHRNGSANSASVADEEDTHDTYESCLKKANKYFQTCRYEKALKYFQRASSLKEDIETAAMIHKLNVRAVDLV